MNKTSTWDTAEFLETQEDIYAYLEIAFATEDPKQITKALGNVARAEGMMKIANKTGIAREQLYASFSEHGNPTLQTFNTLVNSLGYRLSVLPRQENQGTFLSM
ncbi:MAG: putative addiction module antidote protein [Oscillospiraceae bacterium]|jgi:probable addiction module antidote protein|nr:putative addiction module antidote protein [Oscillospiraceae bacterium]